MPGNLLLVAVGIGPVQARVLLHDVGSGMMGSSDCFHIGFFII